MKDLIYCQRDIPREQWRYGFRSSAATGCGWIATYNALRLMGYTVEPEALIRCFQRQLPLIHGNAGTSFWGPAERLRRWGFPVKMIPDPRRFDDAARDSDVCILFYRWRRGWKLGAHFVALEYRQGRFRGYNTYRNSTGPDDYGESLREFLKKKGYYGAVLTTVQRKPSETAHRTVSG